MNFQQDFTSASAAAWDMGFLACEQSVAHSMGKKKTLPKPLIEEVSIERLSAG